MIGIQASLNFKPVIFILASCFYCSCVSPSGGKNPWEQHLRIQEGHFLKIALNLDLTLSDDGECPTFFNSLWNYWFRCFLRRVMAIFRQRKNFGSNVIYFALGISMVAPTRRVNHPSRVASVCFIVADTKNKCPGQLFFVLVHRIHPGRMVYTNNKTNWNLQHFLFT